MVYITLRITFIGCERDLERVLKVRHSTNSLLEWALHKSITNITYNGVWNP
jgi:hypothetical protein